MAGALTVVDSGLLYGPQTYTQADATLPAGHTVVSGTWAVDPSNDRLYEQSAAASGPFLYFSGIADRADAYVQLSMAIGGSTGGFPFVTLRAANAADANRVDFAVEGTPDGGVHYRYEIGVGAVVVGTSDTTDSNIGLARVNCSLVGGTARMWREGVLRITALGVASHAGKVALRVTRSLGTNPAYFDNVLVAAADYLTTESPLPAGWTLRYGAAESDPSDGVTPPLCDIGGLLMPLTGDVEVLDGNGNVRATLSGATLYGGAVLSFTDTPRYDVTLFEDDGVTPILGTVDGSGNVTESSFSTDGDHSRPWLAWPKEGRAPEVDFLSGKAKIGQQSVTVGDFWSDPTDQTTGQITALLGPYEGLNGLRCRLTYTEATGATVVIIDGPVTSPKLDGYAAYTWGIRDENWRTRKVKAFYRTGTTSVFPRGPVEPYGLLPSGEYLVPAAEPAAGTYDADDALQGTIQIGNILTGQPWRRVLTPAMTDAAAFTWDESAQASVLKNVTVRWRTVAGPGAWHELVGMPAFQRSGAVVSYFGLQDADLFNTTTETIRVHGTDGREKKYENVEVIEGVRIRSAIGDGSDLPADGTAVEVQVIYTGPASPAYPLHYSGTAGGILAACYDGDFSAQPMVVRYAAAALAAFDQPCNARITKPTDDLLGWLEKNWYQPLAASPTVDDDGRIAPTRYLLPSPDATLLTLDNATLEASPDYEHGDDGVINEPTFTYYRDVLVDPRDDPTGTLSAGDGVWAREINIEEWENQDGTGPSHDRFGSKPHEIKTELFRGLGRSDGTAAGGEATSEIGHILGRERCKQAMDRYLFGAPIWPLHAGRDTAAGVRLGDWIECGATWLPDYASHLRGMNRVAQVVGIHPDPLSPRVTLSVEDGGDSLAPLAQPTVGVAAENANGGVTFPVTAVVASTEALVEFAVSGSQPAANSNLWLPAGRIAAAGDVPTPQLPAGASVWIGARSVAAGRRPSLRTTPQQVIMTAEPRLTGVRVAVDEDTGEVTVYWTPNAYALGVRIYSLLAATELGGTPVSYYDEDAAAGLFVLPGVTALVGQLITVDAEPWDGYTGAAVSGSAGPKVRAYGGLGYGPVINSLTPSDNGDGSVTLDADFNSAVVRTEVWSRTDGSPLSGGEPLDQYSKGRYKPTDFPITWSCQDGTQNITVRAFDELGQVAEMSTTQATTGADTGGDTGGGAISDTPGEPNIRPIGVPSGGMLVRRARWVNTNIVLLPQVQWLEDGVVVATHTLTAAATSEDRNTSDSVAVSVRLRYTDGGGVNFGPWTDYSNEV
jgi:hypothetical protein